MCIFVYTLYGGALDLIDMRQVVSHARADRAQTFYRKINAKSKSERVEEGASIIAMAFASELQLAA